MLWHAEGDFMVLRTVYAVLCEYKFTVFTGINVQYTSLGGWMLGFGFSNKGFPLEETYFTLCPCFPGSPASPLTPLWPFNQTENKTINIVGGTNMIFNIKQNTWGTLLTFMPGRPGCPGVPGGHEFGHWTTKLKVKILLIYVVTEKKKNLSRK